jgi:TonB family protein
VAQAPYLYNAETHVFVTYDDVESEALKTKYVKDKGLAGVMFWQYTQDPDNVLLDAVDAGLGLATVASMPPTVSPGITLRETGGSVLPPVLIHLVDPEFSPQARAEHFSGSVIVGLWVDTTGAPRDVHVIRGVGMGLDEEAVKSVKQYKFTPATENGAPVPVKLSVRVNFQILKDTK